MVRHFFWFALLFLSVSVSFGSAEELEPLKLTRNPFDYSGMNPRPRAQENRSPEKSQIQVELRATLVAGVHSIANINGKHLVVGETIDGYRLLTVKEGEVILVKDDKRIMVTMQETTTSVK